MLRTAIVLCGLCVAGCATAPDEKGRPLTDAESRTTAEAASSGVSVCELVGRDAVVKVLATNLGTRYTLCTLNGEPVATELDAAGLARLRPDLDPGAMRADWGRGALMMADFKD